MKQAPNKPFQEVKAFTSSKYYIEYFWLLFHCKQCGLRLGLVSLSRFFFPPINLWDSAQLAEFAQKDTSSEAGKDIGQKSASVEKGQGVARASL